MSTAVQIVADADALLERVDAAGDDVSGGLASLAAAYRAARDSGNGTAWLHGRALLRGARGVDLPAAEKSGYDGLKVDALKADVESRNEGREESDLIVPDGKTKAALVAALEADDARE